MSGNPEGKALAEEGALAAAEASGRDWMETAMRTLQWMLADGRFSDGFTSEDLRDAADMIAPEPKDQRAWGAVMGRAAKMGLIRRSGFGYSRNKQAHNRPVAVWVKA